MPQIPGYEQQVGSRGPIGPQPQNLQFGQLIRAGQEIQQDLDVREARQQRELEDASLVTATADLQAARSKWSEEFSTRSSTAQPGAAGFAAGVLKDFDTDAKERISKARTDGAREYLTNRLGEVRLGLQEDAQRFEAASAMRDKQGKLETSVESARTAVSFRPQDHDTILKEQMLAIAAAGLPEDQRAEAALLATRSIGEAAVEGMIRRDPRGALREINNEKSGLSALQGLTLDQRDRMRSAAQSEINRRETEARARQAEAQAGLRADVADAFAARMFGMPATMPERSQYVAAYGAKGADMYVADTKRWAVFDVVGEAVNQPPVQAAKTLERLKPKSQEGAADAAEVYESGLKLYGRQREALERNPVETLLRSDPVVQGAAAAAAAEPAEKMGAYMDALRSKQAALGVAEPKLLTEAQRIEFANNLVWDAKAPRRRTETLAQLRAVYGDSFNDVIREVAPKLDGMARVLIHMNPTDASRLDAAYGQADSFKASSTVQAAKSDLSSKIGEQLAELASTLTDQPDGIERYEEHANAALIYAQSLVFGGATTDDAAKQAADAIVNSQFTYRDTLRIPQPYDADVVVQAAESKRAEVATKGGFLVEALRFSTPEQAQADMANVIRLSGYWITNERGDGIVLRIPHRSGQGEVRRADGNRVEYSFEELAASEHPDVIYPSHWVK